MIRDILHRLRDRFPRHVPDLARRRAGRQLRARGRRAIRGFNALPEAGRSRAPI